MKTQWKCCETSCPYTGTGIPPESCPLCDSAIDIVTYGYDFVDFVERHLDCFESRMSRLIDLFGPNSFLSRRDSYNFAGLEFHRGLRLYYVNYNGDRVYRSLFGSFFSIGEEEWVKAGTRYQELKKTLSDINAKTARSRENQSDALRNRNYELLAGFDKEIEDWQSKQIPLEREIKEIEERFSK